MATYFRTDTGYAIWCQRGSCSRCKFRGCECPHHEGGVADPEVVATCKENSVARGWMGARCQLGTHDRCRKTGCACKCHSKGTEGTTKIIKEEAPIASEEHVKELQERIYAAEASFLDGTTQYKELAENVVFDLGKIEGNIQGKVAEFDKRLSTMEAAKRVEIKVPGKAKPVDVGLVHKTFPRLLELVARKHTVFLVGPAGGGKTFTLPQLAKALGVEGRYAADSISVQTTKSDIMGYKNANGEYVESNFYKIFKDGGVYLGDEVDAGHAGIMTTYNMALSNHKAAFPCGMVERHKDAYFLFAGNTFGKGADAMYVGRNQLDAATLNRFKWLVWDYDWDLARTIAQNNDWVEFVERLHLCAAELKLRVVIGMRQALTGAIDLAAGDAREQVEYETIWGPMDKDDRMKITALMEKKYPQAVTESQAEEASGEVDETGSDDVPVQCKKCGGKNIKDNRTFNQRQRQLGRNPIPDFKCEDCGWHRWPSGYDWRARRWN